MKKYTSDEFVATQYGIYKAAQDVITSFPSTIIANGANASAVIKGNMQQAGTPTPTTPIYPTECGDLETTGEHTGQYKIPILNNSQTTNVYLGEVETTRRVKKLVLDGTENWQFTTYPYCTFITDYLRIKRLTCVCSHLQAVSNINIGESIAVNTCCFLVDNYAFYYKDTSFSSVTDFKTYLAQQYAAGTPITIWYVLATPTTGIVNEPLRKIDTYADSVAASTIPTTAGSQTFNIDTILKPSEVDLTYTGWHMYDEKKYSGGWS